MRFEDVSFSWPDGTPLLAGLSLSLEAGTITALVGPSGCGKSTVLRLAAALLSPTAGAITGLSEEGVAFVFQSPNLLPWRSVRDNVALPLQLRGVASAKRRQRTDDVLGRVGLSEAADALPAALSGGMRMRASLARALVTEPSVLLMDEPFSALDTFTRRQMHAEFLGLWQRTDLTVLFVTHDLEEAVQLADRVVVIAGQPVTVIRDVSVALPRPRPRRDPALLSLVTALEQALEEDA
ncbi:MAG: NitT/TauT family transport system ATP-binding protein [Myxococcota bacterium]|jgi:NitT/TauT family transport system ATP-binding protein